MKRRKQAERWLVRQCAACGGAYTLRHDHLCASCRQAARQALPGYEGEKRVGYRIETDKHGATRIRMGAA